MNGMPTQLTERFREISDTGESQDAVALLSPYLAAGDAEAQFLRAHVLLQGEPLDTEENSLRLLQESASRGYLPAIFEMGMNYLFGEWGVKADEAAAARCFATASRGGFVPAHYEFGLALLHGKGVERDAERAMGLIRNAAAAGNEYALEFLALNEGGE